MGDGAGVSTGAAACGGAPEALVLDCPSRDCPVLDCPVLDCPALDCPTLCCPAPALGAALPDASAAGGAADPWVPVVSLSVLAGALLVARSSVTIRVGSGALAGSFIIVGAEGFGPDNSSGTTSTTSATKIEAPISRSLTRRSITAKYIREARRAAAILPPPANRARGRPCETIRTPRFDLPNPPPRAPRRIQQRHRPQQ